MTIPRPPSARFVAGVVLCVLIAGCAPADQTPSPTVPATAAPTGTPAASQAPSPTPDGSVDDAVYADIEAQVEALRGLKATTPVAREVLDDAGLREFVTKAFTEQNPATEVADVETMYKALLLLPQDESLENTYIDLLSSQVLGLYDEETKRMYVVARSGEIGPLERITYAHEYTHALQDQAFDLGSLLGEARDQGDRTLAQRAQVEGDATVLMSLWAQSNLTPQELAEVGTAASDPVSQAVLERMPKILSDPLMFQYIAGASLVLADFMSGGWDAVDARYADLPESTEQVLHPEKLAAHEPPVPVVFPDDLAARLGAGWAVSLQDTLGEMQLEVLLRDAAGVTSADSDAGSAGWGGDRVALLKGPGGAEAVVLDTAWDTPADATEFSAALGGLVPALEATGRAAAILTPARDRGVLISADDEATLRLVSAVLGLAG